MAIGRVSGSMLVSNLDRQGTDLQFTTNSQPLVYMNFSQFKLGVNTSSLSETLTINGNLSTTNVLINGSNIGVKSGTLQVNNPINLGDIGNVKITGGTANYIVTTDGAGNLTFANLQTLTTLDGFYGNNIPLGSNTVGSFGNALTFTTATKVTDAIASLNQLLGNITNSTGSNIHVATATVNGVDVYANLSATASNVAITQTWLGNIQSNVTTLLSNAATQETYINTINANVSAANSAIATLQTQVYSNANVASYLTVFNGNVNAGNVNLSGNLHADFIAPNVNSVVTFTGTSAIKLPIGNDANRPTGAIGEIRYNTQSSAPEYYNGTTWVPITNTVTDQTITGDDVNSVYTLDQVATNVGTLVSVNGTLQQPGVAYNISGNQITFAEVMLSSDVIDIRYLGGVVSFNNQLNDDLTISGNLTVNGNLSYNNFYYGNILPQTTLVSNIGSTAKQFNTIFASNLTIANAATIGGNITVNGVAGVYAPNRPAFRVYGSSSSDILSGNTITATQGTTIDYNQGSYYNNTTGIFTAPVAGIYSAKLNLRVGTNNGLNQAAISKNNSTSGANVIAFWETDTNTGVASHFGVSGDCYLAVGDTIRVKVISGKVQFDSNDSWSVTYIG